MAGSSSTKKAKYHHGDLRQALILAATSMVEQEGVNNLSLRKLAEQVNVSRTAAYHHFKDKHDLLCAIAAQGFAQWTSLAQEISDDSSLSAQEKFKQFFLKYIQFAIDNSAIYELMFGHQLWQSESDNSALTRVSYPCFQYQVEMTRAWQQQGLFPIDENPTRLAQVTWATMHGLAKLYIDGIYTQSSTIEQMCDTAINLLLKNAVSS
ncbi:TetR/AcrR family transcriptional regulator [Thalassotalea sp. LPB0316]|uniref:TetR/AcrR family transcriptional regulator n=1 Tax=Thalassotalea sp. LPB0316 TaxID=2769490 RepID=UPI001866FB93|nr:TetR/AcrR family transcriptional regulator [Thalassotalea sp. LPB0316]QOL25547.1 TetR/AcrR family transcriptional regulator [Thalassotalea sp. LPB0316]